MAKEDAAYTIIGSVVSGKTRQGMPDLRVEAWDKDIIADDFLADATTDSHGSFRMEFTHSRFQGLFFDRKPDLFFKVFDGGRLIHSTENSVVWNLKKAEQRLEIAIDSGESWSTPAILRLTKASGHPALSQRLAGAGLTSLGRIGRMPFSRIEKALGSLDPAERAAAMRVHKAARTVGALAANATVQYQRSRSQDSTWYAAPKDGMLKDLGELKPLRDFDQCDDGAGCFNVFSPIAYIYDLLDFVLDNWGIPSNTLKGILFQDIDDLNCDEGMKPVEQIRLSVGVLEKYLNNSAPATNPEWVAAYRTVTQSVLTIAAVKTADLPASVRSHLNSASPTIAGLDTVLAGLSDAVAVRVDAENPMPAALPAGADAAAQNDYIAKTATVNGARATAKLEFAQRAAQLSAPAAALYRDKIIASTGKSAGALEDVLFIDLRSSPTRVTNRITQLIQSIQSFVLAIRTGEIAENERLEIAALFNGGYDFDDASWTWLSNYRTWAAAMYVLVYPENAIMAPLFRSSMTYGFRQATQPVASSATAANIDSALAAYDDHLKTIVGLSPVSAHVIDGTLYSFAIYGPQLWMNAGAGWKPASEQPDDAYAIGTALYAKNGETRIIGAFWTSTDHTAIEFHPVSLDGEVMKDPNIPETNVTEVVDNYFQFMLNGQLVFETLEGASQLTPALTFIMQGGAATPRRLLLRDLQETPATIDVPAAQASMGSVVDHAYYRMEMDYGAQNRPTLRNTGSGASRQFQFTNEDGGDPPGYLGYSRAYVLATNHEGAETWLITKTTAGSILSRKIVPSAFSLETGWTAVSPAPMQAAAEGLGGGANAAIPLFLQQTYFEERYLYFPLFAGWALNRAGDYIRAHDWYRKLYDPFNRESKYGFSFDAYFTGNLERADSWLSDTLDPFRLAAQRERVYLRHVIIMMVKNLLDWADHDFALGDVESVNRAREVYLLADRILRAPELKTSCQQELSTIRFRIVHYFGRGLKDAIPELGLIDKIKSRSVIADLAVETGSILESSKTLVEKTSLLNEAVHSALAADDAIHTKVRIGDIFESGAIQMEAVEQIVFAYGAADFFDLSEEARPRYQPSLPSSSIRLPIPPNPLLKMLDYRIQSNLLKLRMDCNLAGFVLSSPGLGDPYAPPGGTVIYGPGGPPPVPPPHYRYSYLAEKARQQVSFAQQLGGALLQAIEKTDAEAYNRLMADHAVAVADAALALKDLALKESQLGETLKLTQATRVETNYNFWNDRVNSGPFGNGTFGLSEAEVAGMGLMAISGGLQLGAAAIYGLLGVPAMVAAAAGGASTVAGGVLAIAGAAESGSTGVVTPPAWVGDAMAIGGVAMIGAGIVGGSAGMLVGGGQYAASSLQSLAGAAGTFGSLALTFAGFQRRWEDWNLQYELAFIDRAIADAEVDIATNRVAMSVQDQQISQLQLDHSRSMVDFLKTKFSNKELYEWMKDTLREQYQTVMQIAASTARLAQRALEFERQESIRFISGAYWLVDMNAQSAALTTEQRSSGLLSAERLLTDLTQLDGFKVATDRRRQEVSKTISLARMAPAEFAQIRQTGRITFNTLMEWFDWDFPGQYMRLIKSVKVTVAALVPPMDGIHALLTAGYEPTQGGLAYSSVVVEENGTFVKKRSVRDFGETIALDSAYNDTGLFVLDYNDPMFLPFEALGVETLWTLELPRATNRFNFDTIVDVMFTIEYTAMYSPAYRREVIARLGESLNTDTFVDVRSMFPDQWYRVKNPVANVTGVIESQKLLINLPRTLFPPNLLENPPLQTVHLTMIVVGKLQDQDPTVTSAIRQAVAAITVVKGTVTVSFQPTPILQETYHAYSTRNNDPAQPDGFPAGTTPSGEWTITIDKAFYTAAAPIMDRIDDIILVVNVRGKVRW
jgi:hypothetical protein